MIKLIGLAKVPPSVDYFLMLFIKQNQIPLLN